MHRITNPMNQYPGELTDTSKVRLNNDPYLHNLIESWLRYLMTIRAHRPQGDIFSAMRVIKE
jgi:hypothetical protein